mgnify:CR=1 FL=1
MNPTPAILAQHEAHPAWGVLVVQGNAKGTLRLALD